VQQAINEFSNGPLPRDESVGKTVKSENILSI
jgi:hypothetical protein